MSLIVTSSAQSQYANDQRNNRLRTGNGLENPSSFQNFFTSAIKIPANAEIAVESIKIRRDALYDIEAQTSMYMYFGKLQTTGSETTEKSKATGKKSRVDMPVPLRPRPGVYSTAAWLTELNRIFNESYQSPEIYGKWVITGKHTGRGALDGLDIKCTQRGVAGAGENQIQPGRMLTGYWRSPHNLSKDFKPTTDWTCTHVAAAGAAAAYQLFTRLKAPIGSAGVLETLDAMSCSVQGDGHVWAQNSSKFTVDTSGAKANGWRVGLARPQIEYIRTTDPAKRGAARRGNLLPGTRQPAGYIDSDSGPIFTTYGKRNGFNGRNQVDFYDYMIQDDGTNIEIYQCSFDASSNKHVMSEVIYYGGATSLTAAKFTKGDFNAKYVGVNFSCHGDEVRLGALKADGSVDMMVDSLTRGNKKFECFVPLGATRDSLYPRLNLSHADNTLKLETWSSHYSGAKDFRYPINVPAAAEGDAPVFTTGDDYYSNNRVSRNYEGASGVDTNRAIVQDTKDRPYSLSQTLVCDTKPAYDVDQSLVSTETQSYSGQLTMGVGTNKFHAMIIGYNKPLYKEDYLEGKYLTTDTSGQAKMNSILGFPQRGFIDQVQGLADGYVAALGLGGKEVVFASFVAPTYRVHSAFVRLSSLPVQSFNGAKSSVSKIVYHLPRFTNDGREFGDLFFSPGEKTYIALNNVTSQMLNNIDVQIVDVGERPVEDISGNTIVVFHIREKK